MIPSPLRTGIISSAENSNTEGHRKAKPLLPAPLPRPPPSPFELGLRSSALYRFSGVGLWNLHQQHQSQTGSHAISSPGPLAFGLGLNYTTSCRGAPARSQGVWDFSDPASQSCDKSSLICIQEKIYICICIYMIQIDDTWI